MLLFSGFLDVTVFALYFNIIARANAKPGRKARGKSGAFWGDDRATVKFLDVYLKYKALHSKNRKKKEMWDEISADLWVNHGFDYSADQCKDKIKCLTAYFNSNVLKTQCPSRYKFYHQMKKITRRADVLSTAHLSANDDLSPPSRPHLHARKALFPDSVPALAQSAAHPSPPSALSSEPTVQPQSPPLSPRQSPPPSPTICSELPSAGNRRFRPIKAKDGKSILFAAHNLRV